MRWVSTSGEFAFLSVGGVARGIIAIGGVAHGVVAIGGIASAGVISIGMNAIGSVLALGMNTLAPISLSLINGLGILTVAGVNGWGAWAFAGTNAGGISSHGGVNSDLSFVPAVLVILILLVLSSVRRGRRERRTKSDVIPLRHFARSLQLDEARVRARLGAVRDDAIELVDDRESLVFRAEPVVVMRASAFARSSPTAAFVVARVARVAERVPSAEETSYRERPAETTRKVSSCLEIELAPEPESWLPKNADEVEWVIAWSARLAAVVSAALIIASALR